MIKQETLHIIELTTTPQRLAFLLTKYPQGVNLLDKYGFYLEKYNTYFGPLVVKQSTFERQLRHEIQKNAELRTNEMTYIVRRQQERMREFYGHY